MKDQMPVMASQWHISCLDTEYDHLGRPNSMGYNGTLTVTQNTHFSIPSCRLSLSHKPESNYQSHQCCFTPIARFCLRRDAICQF